MAESLGHARLSEDVGFQSTKAWLREGLMCRVPTQVDHGANGETLGEGPGLLEEEGQV